jgi:hypothetical protein
MLSSALWQNPDIRWLTGVHEAKGHSYVVKESYEELLWWLQLPALCKLAGESAPAHSAIQQIRKAFNDAAELAASAGYRVDTLVAPKTGAAEAANPAPAGFNPDLEERKAEEKNPTGSPEG